MSVYKEGWATINAITKNISANHTMGANVKKDDELWKMVQQTVKTYKVEGIKGFRQAAADHSSSSIVISLMDESKEFGDTGYGEEILYRITYQKYPVKTKWDGYFIHHKIQK